MIAEATTTVTVYTRDIEDTQDTSCYQTRQLDFNSLETFPRSLQSSPWASANWQKQQFFATPRSGLEETSEISTTASRWFVDGVKQLSKLRALEKSYDGYGTRAPNQIATELAKKVLEELDTIDFEPSVIDPSSDEGICISFRRNSLYADIECFNDGEIIAATKVDGEEPTIWELASENISESITKIILFMG